VLDGRDLAARESAFVADGGGNLKIRTGRLPRAGNGITVKMPDAATGTFQVRVEDLVIRNNGLHGILINDQAEYFNDPLPPRRRGPRPVAPDRAVVLPWRSGVPCGWGGSRGGRLSTRHHSTPS
jgi:hypothetical protein